MKRKSSKERPGVETDAWIRGYKIAHRDYPAIRDCRIFAMAYAQGFMNGRRAARKDGRVR